MQRSLPLLCLLACLTQPAFASNDITNLGTLSQAELRALSEDLGSTLSYKPLSPAAPLGTTGFDMGIEGTRTDIAKSSQAWSKITPSGLAVTQLSVPRLHVAKGLPFGIDIGGFYSKIPTTNIAAFGAEVKYAILQAAATQPAVAVRGAFTKMAGVSQLDLNTKSLDLSASQSLMMFTPYAGIGRVWVSSTPNGVPALHGVGFSQSKVFAGANLNLVFANFAAEWDKTGSARSLSIKAGFRF